MYKLDSHEDIEKGTSIADDETFVIFDEYRTRGADMKMDANITAVLSITPSITKDTLMQAVGRLRKIGRNQKVIILLTAEIKEKIKADSQYKDSLSTRDKVREILYWACVNSVKDNEKFMLPNVKLAKKHLLNIEDPTTPHIEVSSTNLRTMYQEKISYKTVA